jgi:ankyrin repeat protein
MDDVSKAYGAAYHGNLAMLQSFAERNPRILHAHHGGDSLLIRAARGNRGEVVEWLLSQGVDVNEEGFCWGAKTAMMSACYEGHLSMVRLLLSRGAALNHKHDSSWAPIMCAAYKGHTAVVEELLRYVGGDLRKLRAHNEALAYALRNGAVGPVELLLGAGADVTGFERQAGSLRWFWCEKAKAEACRRMLQVSVWGPGYRRWRD